MFITDCKREKSTDVIYNSIRKKHYSGNHGSNPSLDQSMALNRKTGDFGVSDLYASIQQAEQVKHGTHTLITTHLFAMCHALHLSTSHMIIYYLMLKENPCDTDSIMIPIYPRDEENLPGDLGCVQ